MGGEPEGIARGTPGYGDLAELWSREAGGPAEDGTLHRSIQAGGTVRAKVPERGQPGRWWEQKHRPEH